MKKRPLFLELLLGSSDYGVTLTDSDILDEIRTFAIAVSQKDSLCTMINGMNILTQSLIILGRMKGSDDILTEKNHITWMIMQIPNMQHYSFKY